MNIEPRPGVLLIRKHKNTKISADILIEESETDKNLITGEVLAGNDHIGKTIIAGKYAFYTLNLQGEEYHFLEETDIVGFCDYKEE